MINSKKFEGKAHNYRPVKRIHGLISDSEYIEKRLNDQIEWHKKESVENKKKYSNLNVVDTIVAALVPLSIAVSTVFPDLSVEAENHTGFWITRGISVLSGIYVAISAGFFDLERFESKWKDYDRLYKKLEAEKFKYLTRAEPYDEEDAFSRLVFSVENYLHQDMMNFFKTQKKELIQEVEVDPQIADQFSNNPAAMAEVSSPQVIEDDEQKYEVGESDEENNTVESSYQPENFTDEHDPPGKESEDELP